MIGRLGFFIKHSLNDLKVNKQRTLFALLCIAAGVAAIVSLQTLAVMMNKTLTGSLQESNRGDIRLTPGSTWGSYIIEVDEGQLEGNHVFTAKGIDHVREWLDQNYPGSTLTYRQAVTGGFAVAMSASIPARDTYKTFIYNFIVDAKTYPLYGSVKTKNGKDLADLIQEPTDIVLSENLAEDLEAQVGDKLRLAGATQDFTVRGIVRTDTEGGFQNFVAHIFGYFYLDFSAVPLFPDLTPEQASTLYIRLNDPGQVDQAARRLKGLSWAMNATTTTELRDNNKQLSEGVDNLVVVMGLVSLLIGGIGIVNTMLVIVSRRTTEVAVLKTLGLEPGEVIALFLVEAVLMGIVGSLAGIFGGWVLAYAVKGVAEAFLGQRLAFAIAAGPALNGFVVGIVISAIFGFLPTLAAGQIRPANVLRPNDTIIPHTGRLSAFVAIACLILALSLVAQGLLAGMLNDVDLGGGFTLQYLTAGIGAGYGLVIALATVISGIRSMQTRRRGRSWLVRALVWLVTLAILPALGALYGYTVPAIIVLTVTIVIVGYLYIALWLVIWAVGGGRVREIWPAALVLLFPLFWPLIPILIGLLIPTWILGRLIQRFAFVDFKIAMRSMLATKGRGASTLMALVIGVFTLSVITMLVDTITNAFESLLEQATGGNIMIVSAGGQETIADIRTILTEDRENVRSFAIVGNYQTQLQSYWVKRQNRELSSSARQSFRWAFESIDGREITSNLPDVTFTAGRNLDPARDSSPNAEGYWSAVYVRDDSYLPFDISVGDRFTVSVGGSKIPFEIVGVAKATIQAGSSANVYVPLTAFGDQKPDSVFGIADVKEGKIREVRRKLAQVPGTFVLETRFINDLLNRIVDQFTSFPILVATLALVTGGIVIANSVALSTLERRREIGIMKAIGMQRERVLGILLLENGLMGIVGGLIGVGISFVALVIMLVQQFHNELGNVIPYGTAFTLMGLCILISLVAALLSVWSASGEKPLNILRYE